MRRGQGPEVYLAVFVVGGATEQHGKFALGFGPVNIRAQHHAVAHFGRYVALHNNLVVLLSTGQGPCPGQGYEQCANHTSVHGIL